MSIAKQWDAGSKFLPKYGRKMILAHPKKCSQKAKQKIKSALKSDGESVGFLPKIERPVGPVTQGLEVRVTWLCWFTELFLRVTPPPVFAHVKAHVFPEVCLEIFHDQRFLRGQTELSLVVLVFVDEKRNLYMDLFIVLLLMFWDSMLHKYPAN